MPRSTPPTKKPAPPKPAPPKSAPPKSPKKASSKASSTKAAAKDSYHHGDLRRALLEAAVVELAEVGVEDLSLRGVARRAGVSHAAPYHHFADKQTLLAHLADAGFARFADALIVGAAGAGTDATPLARLRAIGHAYLQFSRREPALFSLIFGGCDQVHADIWGENSSRSYLVLNDAVVAVRDSAGLGGDPADDAMMYWGLVHGLAKLGLENGLSTAAEVDAQYDRIASRMDALYSAAVVNETRGAGIAASGTSLR